MKHIREVEIEFNDGEIQFIDPLLSIDFHDDIGVIAFNNGFRVFEFPTSTIKDFKIRVIELKKE